MPKRTDIKSVMVIGSGPIVIGQACEFDYSGTQACRVLKAEGLRVILVNSNPATIMTDPEFADATYVEPITPEFVEKVIAKVGGSMGCDGIDASTLMAHNVSATVAFWNPATATISPAPASSTVWRSKPRKAMILVMRVSSNTVPSRLRARTV